MLIHGSALLHSFTVEFSLAGDEAGNWKATIKAPGHLLLEREACDTTPYLLLEEMLAAAFDACRRNYPDRWPKSAPIQKRKAQRRAAR
jgi:hypothetical protein